MRLRGAVGWLMVGAVALSAACDSSVRVGELGEAPPPAPKMELPASAPETSKALSAAGWTLRAPVVPCAIYAIAEVRADETYLGCDGGRIIRYDGAHAELVFAAQDESRIFSLMWAAPDGQIWAGAQRGLGDGATTQLVHLAAGKWTTMPSPGKRVVSIAGLDASNVWIATETEILRLHEGVFRPVFTTTPDAGAFRQCTFPEPNKGFCVGTRGLAVAWDGASWQVLRGGPWSADAEIFGVEVDPEPYSGSGLLVFWGEPAPDGKKDVKLCKVARFSHGEFDVFGGTYRSVARFDLARRRTSALYAKTRTYPILALARNEVVTFGPRSGPGEDSANAVYGPVLALGKPREGAELLVGGSHGLLASLRDVAGLGGYGLALTSPEATLDFTDLSVASDGAAWVRGVESLYRTSSMYRIGRFENGRWQIVAAPDNVVSGRGLAAVGRDRVYTLPDLLKLAGGEASMAAYSGGTWTSRALTFDPRSLTAKGVDDLWIAGRGGRLARMRGQEFSVQQVERTGAILQIFAAGDDVWALVQREVFTDAGVHVSSHLVRWSEGRVAEWELDKRDLDNADEVSLSAVDASHVWRSGKPAAAWDGSTWQTLGFDASAVWARALDEVYFVQGGDISRWDGKALKRVYHGLIPISRISGSRERGFAVGPGGLTIEFARVPQSLN